MTRRGADRRTLGLQVACVAASPVVAALLIPRNGWWALVAAGLAGAALVLGESRKRRAERRSTDQEAAEAVARIESRVAMVAALQPVADSLAGVVVSGRAQRQEMLGVIAQAVVVAAVRQVPVQDVRGGWYEHGTDKGVRVLRRTCSDGRNDTTSSTEFRAGSTEGDAALAMVDADGHLFVSDVEVDPPAGWDPDQVRRYRSFIAVGVSIRGRPLGMLTVDAVQPGALTDEDLQTVRLLASLLRVALAADL